MTSSVNRRTRSYSDSSCETVIKSSQSFEEESTSMAEEITFPKPKTNMEKGLSRCYKLLSSHIGLILILIAFSFIGAAIFQAIESPHEKQFRSQIIRSRKSFLETAWNKSLDTENFRNWNAFVSAQLREYEEELKEAVISGANTEREVWSFWGALFYAGTIFTTIGYGHISPATTAGKVATILYAVVGIPLCLIVLADLGKLFTRALKFLWSFIRRCYYTGTCKKKRKTSPKPEEEKSDEGDDNSYKVDDDFNLPIIVAILVTTVYIFAGAGMYKLWEDNWGYLDAFYFIFISISTIGFGDILPEHPNYFILSSLYVFVGLALVSMCLNVIQEFLSSTLDKAGQRVTHTISKTVNLSLEEHED